MCGTASLQCSPERMNNRGRQSSQPHRRNMKTKNTTRPFETVCKEVAILASELMTHPQCPELVHNALADLRCDVVSEYADDIATDMRARFGEFLIICRWLPDPEDGFDRILQPRRLIRITGKVPFKIVGTIVPDPETAGWPSVEIAL